MTELSDLLTNLQSGDEGRAQGAIRGLTEFGKAAVEALLDLQESPVVDHRWWAAYALSEFPDREAQAGLVHALRDEALPVRQCAALGLRLNPTTRAIEGLVAALQSNDRLLARLAADALAAIGPKAIRALQPLTRSSNPNVRIEAVRSLAQMSHPDAIGPLFACSDDPSTMVTYWVEVGLDRLGIGMAFFSA